MPWTSCVTLNTMMRSSLGYLLLWNTIKIIIMMHIFLPRNRIWYINGDILQGNLTYSRTYIIRCLDCTRTIWQEWLFCFHRYKGLCLELLVAQDFSFKQDRPKKFMPEMTITTLHYLKTERWWPYELVIYTRSTRVSEQLFGVQAKLCAFGVENSNWKIHHSLSSYSIARGIVEGIYSL